MPKLMRDNRLKLLRGEKRHRSSTYHYPRVSRRVPIGERLWRSVINHAEIREPHAILRAHPFHEDPQMLGQLFVRYPSTPIKKAKRQIKDPWGQKVLKRGGYDTEDEGTHATNKPELDGDN